MGRIHMIALVAAACALFVLPASASASGSWDSLLAPESACPGQDDASLPVRVQENAMVCMHRWARAQQSVSGLHISKKLQSASRRKAHDIQRCGQFSHYACSRNPFYWEQRVGFCRGTYGAGENLALTFGAATVRGAMSLWLNSPEHRQNLLAPQYREVGISLVTGRFRGSRGAHIWVAEFGYHH
jgi:uncharacterized protein YkwD